MRLLPGWLAGVEKITDAVLATAPGLKAISRNGTGVDSIDLAACQRRGMAVLRAEGANARGVAELAFGLALALLRSIPFSDARMKAGGWERRQGAELEGKTLGVVGTGKIGKLVARFGLAFDMKVIGADVYPDAALAKTPGFRYAAVGELLASSDVVTLHCPHEPGAKPLADGRLAGYAVDTFETEPPAAHPLLAHERVVTMPHVGAYTAEILARATRVAVDNLLAALGKGAYQMLKGYAGKILRVNLSTSTSSVEPLPEREVELLLGGRGIAAKYYQDEIGLSSTSTPQRCGATTSGRSGSTGSSTTAPTTACRRPCSTSSWPCRSASP